MTILQNILAVAQALTDIIAKTAQATTALTDFNTFLNTPVP